MSLPDLPHLEEVGLKAFVHSLRKAESYLEYGSGSSTILASELGVKTIITVDSDRVWTEAVRAKLKDAPGKIAVLHCDVGPTGEWGVPSDASGVTRFHRYPIMPWVEARTAGVSPQVVMVDGRFRVACFLYSLMCATPGTIILFDDYIGRVQYSVVEQFCPVHETFGRMAGFIKTDDALNLPEIAQSFAAHCMQVD